MISWACCGFGARLGVLPPLDDATVVGPLLFVVVALAAVEDDAAAASSEEWVLLSMALCWCRGHHWGGSFDIDMVRPFMTKIKPPAI